MIRSYLLSGILSLLAVFLVTGEPFFWDTIQLGARHADWFYQNNFSTWLLPDSMDSGHIPAFGWYLAAYWKVFGRSLWVSHLAMWPWVGLVVFQTICLTRKFWRSKINHRKIKKNDSAHRQAGSEARGIAREQWMPTLMAGVLLLDATLVAQLSLISPDIILVGAFLWGVNTILKRRTGDQPAFSLHLAVAVSILGLVSLRGMMVAIGLFIWQLCLRYQDRRLSFKVVGGTLLSYLPGGGLALLYLTYHYYAKGWVGTHDDSPWAASFASAGGLSLFKQTAVVGWRMLDFGRIFLFLALLLAWWRSGWAWNRNIKAALALMIVLGAILALPAIVSPGLAQHRYLLPVYLSVAWLLLNVLSSIASLAWRKGLLILVLVGQLSGHFWVYPDTIAQGWDASLAHKPYFAARAAGLDFLRAEGISLSEVGTTFPAIGPMHWRELNGEQTGMQALDFATNRYIWYSNINNDFSDEQVARLQTQSSPIFSYEKAGIHLYIYQNDLRPSASPRQ